MKQVFIICLLLLSMMTGYAQEGYQITGKISTQTTGTLLLLSDEGGKIDTLGTAQINNGVFVFTGKVATPRFAYIATPTNQGMIPLVLENVPFVLNITAQGALIQGGEQQEIFNRFSKINGVLMQQQQQLQLQYQQAEQAGDKKAMEALMKKFEEVILVARQEEQTLLTTYADSYVAAYVVYSGMYQMSLELLRSRYELLGEKARNSVPGQAIVAFMAQLEAMQEGQIAPDFTASKVDGGNFSLHALKCDWKLLVFWASADPASRQLNPELVKLYRQFRPRGLEIVSFSLDTDLTTWKKAVGSDGLTWANVSDLKGANSEIARCYVLPKLPYILLLDEDNRIVAKDIQAAELREKLTEVTKRKRENEEER